MRVARDQQSLPAPAQQDLAVLDGLITEAAVAGPDGMDGPLVAGLLQFGPHFLYRLAERAAAGEPVMEAEPVTEAEFVRAWALFGALLGGQLYTDDVRQLEWRARAGLELWRRVSRPRGRAGAPLTRLG